MSDLEIKLLFQIRAAGLPLPVQEFRFDQERRWRFDFAWPDLRLAAECEGGSWSRGRHTRGIGYEQDCRKYNQAIWLGWRVLRFTGGMVDNGEALETLAMWLCEPPK